MPRTAVVTGASKGIGRAIAEELAAKGYRLVLVARSDDLLRGIVDDLTARFGAEVHAQAADLTNPDRIDDVIDAATSATGRLDLLVNCAGATKSGDFFALTREDFHEGFALKFHAAVDLTRAAWPALVASGKGHVVNIIGFRARTPSADYTIGGPTNSALANFTKAMAERGVRDGVRVNAVHPGPIETDRIRGIIDEYAARTETTVENARSAVLGTFAVPRFGRPGEIAAAVLFLDSDGASYINGAILDIDGGATKGL
ncbi:SDR family oxidoreductase [Marivibrio halodurans]|uniref:SDR family oxidoreductase n=1 Tax=Marivibrio halodurans TaxID=2039722 RepID=A0A8J7V3Z1_9PROT|nr:SDR family oxidoreductase [Marivibrio halodurans]